MKRFTETTKWDDPWFWELSTPAKMLYLYLLDHCDNSGVVDCNLKLASLKIGEAVKKETLSELGDRIKPMENGKLNITKFVRFQYGSLKSNNNLHKSVARLLQFHGLSMPDHVLEPGDSQGIARGMPAHLEGLQHSLEGSKKGTGTVKVKEEVQEPLEGSSEGNLSRPSWMMCQKWLADVAKNGADYTESECKSAWLALNTSGWMWGRNPVVDWRSGIERQIQTDRSRNNYGTNAKTNRVGNSNNPKPDHSKGF